MVDSTDQVRRLRREGPEETVPQPHYGWILATGLEPVPTENVLGEAQGLRQPSRPRLSRTALPPAQRLSALEGDPKGRLLGALCPGLD